MCGILVSSNSFNSQLFCDALSLLKHRGPDDNGVVIHGNYIWGHVRLSLFDLSSTSNQPIKLNKGGIIVFNGEIFNFKDFGDFPSDTLMLVDFFNKWNGQTKTLFAFLNNLNGFFSIVFEYNDIVYSVRDRFGEKPLYFYKLDDKVVFSSETKAILGLTSVQIDDNRLRRLASDPFDFQTSLICEGFYDTIYQNIFEQKPGHCITYNKQNSELLSYQWYDLSKDICIYESFDTESLLISSIELRMKSDAQGSFSLSGGVDSSLLCSISKNVLNSNTNTFSIVSASKEYSEIDVLDKNNRILSDKNSKIFEEQFISSLTANDIFTKLNHFGYPYFDANIVQYLLYGKVREAGYKFIIDGHGADELFSGYQWHLPALIYSECKSYNFFNVIILVNLYFKSFPINYSFLYKFYTIFRGFFRYLKQDKDKYFFGSKSDSGNFIRYNEIFNRVLLRLLNNYDATSMYSSIETRAPFLDHRLVANILSKKSDFFVGKSNKVFLRGLLSKYSGVSVPTVKIGLRSYIWDFVGEETKLELFNAYNFVSKEFFKESVLSNRDFMVLLATPTGEMRFWKFISVYSLKYFK